MGEREVGEERYWEEDVEAGEALIQGRRHTVRLQVHATAEAYPEREILYTLDHKSGERDYVLAKPYILVPNAVLTISTDSGLSPGGSVGRVVSGAWEGMRHRDIGHAQAWYYRQDRVAVLWECYLFGGVRGEQPQTDRTLLTLWKAFEDYLLRRFPNAERIVTPSWEPIYEDQEGVWREFLRSVVYSRLSQQAFVKDVVRRTGGEGVRIG